MTNDLRHYKRTSKKFAMLLKFCQSVLWKLSPKILPVLCKIANAYNDTVLKNDHPGPCSLCDQRSSFDKTVHELTLIIVCRISVQVYRCSMNESQPVISRDPGVGTPCYSSCAPVTLENGQTYNDPVPPLPSKKKSVGFDLPRRASFSPRKGSFLFVLQKGKVTVQRYVESEKVNDDTLFFHREGRNCLPAALSVLPVADNILTLFHMNKITPYSAWSGSLKTPRYSLQHIYKYWHLRKTD